MESGMRVASVGLFLVTAVAVTSIASAKGQPAKPQDRNNIELRQALSAVAATVDADTPPAKTVDKDQGDDHANPGAILRVCSKNTPAARRSAICPISVSPD